MPTVFINGYIYDKINQAQQYGGTTRFFPASPTAIDDFTEQFPEGNKFYVYDRMLKMRRTPFPHIKEEQMLIYFYARGAQPIPDLYESTQAIVDLLDRGDESGEEVNAWIKEQLDENGLYVVDKGLDTEKSFKPVYFHSFKIFQLEETADIIDFGTARTWAGNKIIIDYKYHLNYPEKKILYTTDNPDWQDPNDDEITRDDKDDVESNFDPHYLES